MIWGGCWLGFMWNVESDKAKEAGEHERMFLHLLHLCLPEQTLINK